MYIKLLHLYFGTYVDRY